MEWEACGGSDVRVRVELRLHPASRGLQQAAGTDAHCRCVRAVNPGG